MKKILFLCFFSISAYTGFSQLGLTAGVQSFQASDWEDYVRNIYKDSDISIFSPTVYLGADYWFRLKNKRIEFTPEIAYASYSTEIQVNLDPIANGLDIHKSTYFGFYFNTNFYLLDFAGDCNCPTFNKDGDLIKKGFFVRLSPGLVYNIRSIESNSTSVSYKESESDFNFSIRAGLGLDIGVTPFLTISPLVMATYNPPTTWTYSVPTLPFDIADSPIIGLFAGIRLGFRFDELNKYGYR